MRYNSQKVRYASVIKNDGGATVAQIQRDELMVDPDLISGFVTAVVIFAKTPIRTIRKAAYDILIEVGDSYLLLFVIDPIPDEVPYRKRMKKILGFVERFSLGGTKPSAICDIIANLERDTPLWIRVHLLQCLLSSLGMSWMGFLDGDPVEHLDFVMPRVARRGGRAEIREYVAEKICEQIDSGGTTIGSDIEKMIKHAPFAIRIQKVLAERKSEIDNVTVAIEGNSVNLKNLWLTAYGYSVLGAVNAGTTCSLATFNKIEQELGKHSITIRTTNNPQNKQSIITNGMQNSIWHIAEYNSGSPSSTIPRIVEQIIEMNLV